jgi:large subunit ribosomal protein L9
MKVILLRDVAKIGKRFEIVNVPDGYALNKLIPKNDAQPATVANTKRVEQQKSHKDSNKTEQANLIIQFVKKTETEPIEIKMEANEQGHLFQGINAKDVCKIAKDNGVDIPEQAFKIHTPIKAVGDHEVKLSIQDKELKLTIKVVAK